MLNSLHNMILNFTAYISRIKLKGTLKTNYINY